MLRPIAHLLLHLIVPAAVAGVTFRRQYLRAWTIVVATMIVDLDHLMATPIYDPNRCSIGFHPLHQSPLIGAYTLLAIWPKTRLIGIGLIIHMALDGIDCVWMQYES